MTADRATLAGVRNTTTVFPSYCLPVFAVGNKLYVQGIYVQGITDEKISEFVPYFGTAKSLLPAPKRFTNVGDSAVFAFAFSPDTVLVGTRQELVAQLNEQGHKLKGHPFIQLELYELAGRTEAINAQIAEIESTLAELNPSAAATWANIERHRMDTNRWPMTTATARDRRQQIVEARHPTRTRAAADGARHPVTKSQIAASSYKCCEYFEAALDPNILRAYLGYCKAREWPFTVMVPIGGLEGECPKPPIKKTVSGEKANAKTARSSAPGRSRQ